MLVATTEFKDAAVAQSRTLGFEPAVWWVEHPIQNRTAEELEALAEASVEGVLSMITAS